MTNALIHAIFAVILVTGNIFICSCVKGNENRENPLTENKINHIKIPSILAEAEGMPYLKSLIIIKDDNWMIEEYMHGGGSDRYIDIRSASKGILSAVLGIALHEKFVDNLDQKVMTFFPEYRTNDLDPRVFDLTIKHLITMKSGFGVKENSKAYQHLYQSSDWVKHILHLRFKTSPGKQFNYLSFNTHLLSAIITKTTGMSTLAYSKQVLFSPLGIDEVRWERDPGGYTIGGWGLSLRARDMAKFGLLYLNGGKWGEIQIVPSDWVKQSTTDRTGMIGTYYSGRDKSYGYGYLWWIKRVEVNYDIPFAAGHGGQRIAFIPKANTVVVTQCDPAVNSINSHKQHRDVDSLLFDNFAAGLLP